MPAKISQEKREKQIKELCEGTIYSFVGWDGKYKNCYSKFIYRCEEHGEWSVRVDSFITNGRRCPSCCGNRPFSQEEREKQIKELCEGTTYSFAGWDGEYKNNNSKFICRCEAHGEWSVSVNDFINSSKRCASCANYGYNPIKKGTLYCLRSECGQFVKIGISNNHKQRFAALNRSTPFDFHVIELFTHEDGSRAREWEKLFHQSFTSANLTGFDGCTEWLKWDPKIPEWFRFIS